MHHNIAKTIFFSSTISTPMIRSQIKCEQKGDCLEKRCGNPAKWPGGELGEQGHPFYSSMHRGDISRCLDRFIVTGNRALVLQELPAWPLNSDTCLRED
jgi:hypothetical protein